MRMFIREGSLQVFKMLGSYRHSAGSTWRKNRYGTSVFNGYGSGCNDNPAVLQSEIPDRIGGGK